MKRFSCGDVVPGCRTSFTASDDHEVLTAVAEHAVVDHGVRVDEDIVAKVRAAIVEV